MTEKKPKALTLAQYEINAHETVSTTEKWDQVDRVLNNPEFIGLLTRYIAIGRSIENYKKAAFHGRGINNFPETVVDKTLEGRIDYNTLHGVIGVVGEAAEAAEVLLNIIEDRESDEPLDKELGDILWYLAVAAKTVGGLEQVARDNNEKLAKRAAERDAIKS